MKSQMFFQDLNLTKASPSINAFLLVLIVNRLQVGYIMLSMPSKLVSGDKFWILILAFIISQFNLFLISKWISNKNRKPISFDSILPKFSLLTMLFLGLVILFIKLCVILVGYTKIIQIYIMQEYRLFALLMVIMAAVAYLSSKGISNIIRFSFFAFLFSSWIVFAYLQFFLAPNTSIRELFPLIGGFETANDVSSLIFLLSAFSGPELLLFLKNWVKADVKPYRALTIGNIFTFMEYTLLFAMAVIFYGPDFLEKVEYPLVTMARYIHTPIIDRLEMFIIPFFLFPLIFSMSLINLFIYKGIQYAFQFRENAATFIAYIVFILLFILFIQSKYWIESSQERMWETLLIYATAIIYMILPAGFFLIKRVKKI